jgi:hypothetical protein
MYYFFGQLQITMLYKLLFIYTFIYKNVFYYNFIIDKKNILYNLIYLIYLPFVLYFA